ncbi:GAF domain-containing protein [uncultured Amaricoccus sp.]|uniref:pyridoxamine 5'-phosphate oxidase family protein n=2 Tax=Amaricoccus TaxID=56999 RepID=UPI0026196C30|nr:GAF domain-containing protein [uncultured Amaricoccus sp.]
MSAPRLSDLRDCFEGVIPSIVATSSEDGMPNVSYLSHVERIDDRHVALSNQFFGKTAANLRANPRASVMLVDGITGRQFRLAVTWLRNECEGPLFEAMAASLRASSAQVGMAEIMRLDSVDIFRVESIDALPHPDGLAPPPTTPARSGLAQAAEAVARVAAETETARIVEALLEGTRAMLRCPGVILFQHDPSRGALVTLASRGYPLSGAGSEIAIGEGIAGAAAESRRAVRVSDMSRVRRFGAAILGGADEDATRRIALPGLPDAQSQLAVPMLAQGGLYGVLFAESPERLAFRADDAAALSMVATHAAALLLGEALAGEATAPAAAPVPSAATTTFRVVHHGFDDSVFIDNGYVIRGVAGRLLVYLLRRHLAEGRLEFSNREIRLAPELRLPDFKDNLETRLLLLRQRLEEKGCPVRLARAGRGLVRLHLAGAPEIEQAV